MSIEKHLDKIQTKKEAVGGFAIDSYQKLKLNEIDSELKKRRVMIDLDGTINKYSDGYRNGELYDDPFEYAKESIDWLKNQGYEIVIFTSRLSIGNAKEFGDDLEKQKKNITAWLKKYDIYFDRLTGDKLAADFYIDDKAIHIKDGNWDDVLHTIQDRLSNNNN